MGHFDKLKEVIGAEAALVDRHMRKDLARIAPETDKLLIEVLEYGLFNGGKRIRPLLVVLAARLCGCRDEAVYDLGMAFEYLHAATLFHDDVIDNAETRRGKLAVNRQFGLVAAILAGDFLHARSMNIVGDMVGREGLAIFCRATSGMVDGEFMQLRNTDTRNLSEPGYYEAIMGKTGLLIAAACQVGAMYGGGSVEQQMQLCQYGVGLGCAFQMIDDLLDYTGDTKKTGKAVGNDLVEGKMTLPLIFAWERATEGDRSRLETILADPEERQGSFAEVCALIERYDGFADTRREAEKNIDQAIARLQGDFGGSMAGESESREILTGLARYIVLRDK